MIGTDTVTARQFILFAINGAILGVTSWASQLWIYQLLGGGSINYAISTALIYPPFVAINFMIQRHAIFLRKGCFVKFIGINLLIMGLVSLLSPIIRWIVSMHFDPVLGDRLGFAVAAVLCVPLSFLLKKNWVFEAHK